MSGGMEAAFAVDTTGHHGEPAAKTWRSIVKAPLIGCLCGSLGRLIDYPLDTIKVRLQTASLERLQANLRARAQGLAVAPNLSASSAQLESPWQCLRNTVSREGVRGLYRGCITPCMGAAVEDSISFGVFHTVARLIGTPPAHRGGAARPEDLPLAKVFVSGSCGGMATALIATPLELIKCRLQSDRVSRGEGGAAPRYKGPLDCLVQSVRAEGVRVLYRGLSATLAREGLGTGVWFTTYEMSLRSMAPNCARDDVPTPIVLLSGAFSGVMLNAVPYPFDTVKSVLQTLQGGEAGGGGGGGGGARGFTPPRGIVDAFKLIVEAEGVAGLYRGITPALLRAMPANAAVFLSVSASSSRCRRLWQQVRAA
jgi:hypothetical protein